MSCSAITSEIPHTNQLLCNAVNSQHDTYLYMLFSSVVSRAPWGARIVYVAVTQQNGILYVCIAYSTYTAVGRLTEFAFSADKVVHYLVPFVFQRATPYSYQAAVELEMAALTTLTVNLAHAIIFIVQQYAKSNLIGSANIPAAGVHIIPPSHTRPQSSRQTQLFIIMRRQKRSIGSGNQYLRQWVFISNTLRVRAYYFQTLGQPRRIVNKDGCHQELRCRSVSQKRRVLSALSFTYPRPKTILAESLVNPATIR